MAHVTYTITFQDRTLTCVGVDTDNLLNLLDMIIYENLHLAPFHHWWKDTYKVRHEFCLRSVDPNVDDAERFLAHVDEEKRTVEIIGTTKNCVAWENSEYIKPEFQNPEGWYAGVLEVLAEDNGLTAIVPAWDVKTVYENHRHRVLMDSDGYLYLIDKMLDD